ncbi:MAG: hypothetical protein FJY92_09255 [Candidatus Hydrogenedentes bacterium]|nr:hypothetical protein [Candidatus Hydrogenedentota bacterium]
MSNTIRRVIDNRVLVLGLDWMYREAIKPHERGELLDCARRVADALHLVPARGPVEGYYAEDPALTEYFQTVRALQGADGESRPAVSSLAAFQRLIEVMASPIFGRAQRTDRLLPSTRDPLTQALAKAYPTWDVPGLTADAAQVALASNDYSLVGLAARARDPVLIAATRESTVLYADAPAMASRVRPTIEYVWDVEPDLADAAGRFVAEFNALFRETLPAPRPAGAEHYWHAHGMNTVLGRCVRIGTETGVTPPQHYHWGICLGDGEDLVVHDFWDKSLWTTQRFRATLRGGRPRPQNPTAS